MKRLYSIYDKRYYKDGLFLTDFFLENVLELC